MTDLATSFEHLARCWIPRILTQVDRNPESKTAGCADRNWWHYKIRDFPSIILQQAGYAVAVAADLPVFEKEQESFNHIARSSCLFWQKRAVLRGAFEEYYPWEQGFPPLAFSTLAVAKLAAASVVPVDQVHRGLAIAGRQLQDRFEPQAANQQVAGLAALAWIRKLDPALVDDHHFERLARKTLALQSSEGWYMEYDGPDLGYLSVTIDCLWDLFDATGEDRYVTSGSSALSYIQSLARLTGGNIGMHNARNTDYIVPYGIIRFAAEPGTASDEAQELASRLFGTMAQSTHPLHATDDRYLCHYIGASVMRAAVLLHQRDGLTVTDAKRSDDDIIHHESGHVIRYEQTSDLPGFILSPRKGGIVTVFQADRTASEYGWEVRRGARIYTSHWWSTDWTWSIDNDALHVEGRLVPVTELSSTPWRHMLLRCLSYFLGNRLIRFLKRRMIFRKPDSELLFQRRIEWEGSLIRIYDRIDGIRPGDDVRPAPRASRRHVASADSFHPEDCGLARGLSIARNSDIEKGTFQAETVIGDR